MTIYEHRTSLTTASGSPSTTSLNVRGGLLRHFFVQYNTTTTVFRVNLQDQNSLQRGDYGFHTGTLNDMNISMPIAGRLRIGITNASPDDTFQVYVGVEE